MPAASSSWCCTPRSAHSSSIPSRTHRCRRRWTTSRPRRSTCSTSRRSSSCACKASSSSNATRLRLDLDNYASFSHILGVLRQCGIGAVRVDEGVDRKQMQIFVSLLLSYAAKEASPNKVFELGQKLTDGGVSFISVEPPLEADEDVEEEERQKEAA